jgi:hypothetical protein
VQLLEQLGRHNGGHPVDQPARQLPCGEFHFFLLIMQIYYCLKIKEKST